jgi:PAS domain S-box-containing protein
VGDDGVAVGGVGMVADLSDQKRSLAAQLESEAEMRGMFEHAGIGMVLAHPDGSVVKCNPACARMLGTPQAELHDQPFASLVHPDDRDEAAALFAEVVSLRQEACRAEIRFLRQGGRVIRGRLTLSLVREAEGEPRYVIAMVEDVTEARRLEEEVRAAERLRKLIFDNSNDAIFLLGVEGEDRYRHLAANAAYYTGTGFEERAVVGRALDELISPERFRAVAAHYRRALAERRTVRWEETAEYPSGIRTAEVSITPLCKPDGPCSDIVGTIHDVTERKGAEEKIAAQAALLDSAREAILVRGLDHVVRYWNAGATRTYGWTAEEAVGRDVRELLYRGDDRDAFEAATRRTLEDGEWKGELHQVAKDGRPIVTECSWTLVRGADGEPAAVFAINLDVSDRKRLEAQVALAQRMESLGTLAGGIAHDFNNVLAAILGSVAVARLQLPPSDPVQRKLEVIEGAARRATDLVRRILTFSRGAQPRRAVLPIGPVVEEAISLLRATLPAMIRLQVRLAADAFPVAADASQIHQVVMNLATNAVQAMGDSPGVLAIELDPVTLDAPLEGIASNVGPGRYVRLRVADEGHGMDADTLSRIFEPFFTTKPAGVGTGLGLSVVLGIVRGHGGALTVESHPGRGTVFDLYFPAADPTLQPVDEAPAAPVEPGRGERVLFVDDEAAIVTLVTQFLEGLGYRVAAFTDPQRALAAVRAAPERVDALVTDYAMGGISGLALAAEARRARPDLPVVLVSGYPTPEVGDEAHRIGVRVVLGKPDFLSELPRVLASIFAASRR